VAAIKEREIYQSLSKLLATPSRNFDTQGHSNR
jgi:hypothetical protein